MADNTTMAVSPRLPPYDRRHDVAQLDAGRIAELWLAIADGVIIRSF